MKGRWELPGIEALIDLAEVEAQFAQHIRGAEQHPSDRCESGDPKECFVNQDRGEETNGDTAPRAGVGQVLEQRQDPDLVKELHELVEQLAGSGDDAVALTTTERREHRFAVGRDQRPGCADL